MVNITELEKDVIENGFGKNNFNTDGDRVWSWSLVDSCKICTEKQVSGVVSSLVKKGLAQVDGERTEKVVYLTKTGKDLLNEYKKANNTTPVVEPVQDIKVEDVPKQPEVVVLEAPKAIVTPKKTRNIDAAKQVLTEANGKIAIYDAVKKFLEIHPMKSKNPDRQAKIVFMTATEHGVPVVMSEDKKYISLT